VAPFLWTTVYIRPGLPLVSQEFFHVAWATKGEDVGLIVRAISFPDFQPMWPWSTNVTDRQRDRQTDLRSKDRALHSSASRGKNGAIALCVSSADGSYLRMYMIGTLESTFFPFHMATWRYTAAASLQCRVRTNTHAAWYWLRPFLDDGGGR